MIAVAQKSGPLSDRLAALLPVLFFALIGGAMYHTMGHNSDADAVYTVLFYAAVLVMAAKPRKIPEKLWSGMLAAIPILSVSALIYDPVIIYGTPHSPWSGVLQGLLWGALALSIITLASVFRPNKGRALKWAALGAMSLLFLGQILVPLISPHPWIDVFVNNTRAVDHFIHGKNPYPQIYPDIYGGRYDYKPGFLYFPGLLFWLAPFRALFGDIRYGYVFANGLIALGLHALARKLRAPEEIRWLAPLLWLSFPVTFFVLEQSWIDTMLVALTVLLFWAIEEERWIMAGALMGAAFSVKQYGFLPGMIACIALWRRMGLRTAVRAALTGAATALIVILPFALADWQHFYASTITAQTSSGVRLDAFNATSFIGLKFGWIIPGGVRMALSALGILTGAFYVARRRNPGLTEAATAIFLGYGTAFLFGKFAFCNYHYLLAGMLLLYLVGVSAKRSSPSRASKEPGSQAERPRTSAISTSPNAPAGT